MAQSSINTCKDDSSAKHILRTFNSEDQFHVIRKIRHDANGHLRGVIELSKLLESQQKDDSDKREMLRLIRTGGENAQRLVSKVTAYAELFSQAINMQSCCADHLLQEVIGNVKQCYTASFYHTTSASIGRIHADPDMFQVMISEMIDNAFLYHDRLSIHRKIDIRVKQEQEYLCIDISDNGIGIKTEHFSRVFHMTERMHTQEIYQGAGVGLSSAQLIARRHKGDVICLNPHDGFNTTIRVMWPI